MEGWLGTVVRGQVRTVSSEPADACLRPRLGTWSLKSFCAFHCLCIGGGGVTIRVEGGCGRISMRAEGCE